MESGYQIWSFKTKAPVNSIPFIDDERVYFGSNDGNVYVLNRDSGKKIWSFQSGRTIQSLVLRYKEMIIFTSDLGRMFFLNLNGKMIHSIPNPYWMHHTFQIYDDIIYWVPKRINFAAYDVRKLRFLKWEEHVTFTGVWYSFPAIDERRVYYGRSVYSRRTRLPELLFKARTRRHGDDVWQKAALFEPGQHLPINRRMVFRRYVDLLDYMAPSLWRDIVIFTSGDTVVRAFKGDSGEIAWTKKFKYPVSSAPTVAGDRVYFGLHGDENRLGYQITGGKKPRLVCISAADGNFLWELEIDGVILSAPVISGNRIMFGTGNYLFYVLEELF